MRFIASALIGCLLAVPVTLATADDKQSNKKDELVCVKTENLAKFMEQKGMTTLLNMTNDNGVVETVWVAGQAVVITAQNKDNSCILALMKDVIYNPNTLQDLVKVYEIQQKKQKDI